MNTSNNNLKEFLLEKINEIKEFVMKNLRIVLPAVVGVVALIVIVICLSAHDKNKEQEVQAPDEPVAESLDAVDVSIAIPELALEENAIPEVNSLMDSYYTAMASGDVDTVTTLNNNIDETEKIRIEETSKYIKNYSKMDVYTKSGPVDGSYLAYVYSEVDFEDYDSSVPGMQAYYVCTDENGQLYINDGEESETVRNYIREVSLQDDVVDLNNEVAVAYNDMLAADENLSVFLVDLTESIDTSVGEALAQAEATEVEEQTEEEPEDSSTGITTEVVTTVKTTTAVNVRSSDSETADKVGKAAEGQEFELIEERGNGWSEIKYDGKSAFIKSEFLEAAGTETVVNVLEAEEDNTASTTETTTTTSDNQKTSGTVTVKENVRIRASASEDGEKLGTVYMGEKLDFVEKMSNGWTKVKYNGKTAYVKSDYVE